MATDPSPTLPPDLALAFKPLHKRAFGMAVGSGTGILLFLVTAVAVIRQPSELNLEILSEYFYGYTTSWAGAFVALGWGFVAGFAAAWFAAFLRNFVMAASIWLVRTRSELEATRDFLDHI